MMGRSILVLFGMVAIAPKVCKNAVRDDFDGDKLDRSRWTTVVREGPGLAVVDGHLIIPTSNTDLFGPGTNTTSDIVLQPLPKGPFTATAKLNLVARAPYQQAGLIVYGDDDNYAKMVLEARPQADGVARVFQFIREESGNPNQTLESNTADLGATYPDEVWVRLTSDGSNLRAAYSNDGKAFIDMPETKSLGGMTDPKIGLVSLSSVRGSPPVIDAKFDWFEICPQSDAK